MLHRIKWITFALAILVAIIIAFQNLDPINVHLLFATVTLPQAVILGIALLLGFVLGLAFPALWRVRSWNKGRKRDASTQPRDLVTPADEESPLV